MKFIHLRAGMKTKRFVNIWKAALATFCPHLTDERYYLIVFKAGSNTSPVSTRNRLSLSAFKLLPIFTKELEGINV